MHKCCCRCYHAACLLPAQPEGLSSAWVLPNVPQQHGPLRAALSLLQHQIDQLMFGSTADRVTGSLAAAALCIVVHRAWAKEAASEESLEQQIDKVSPRVQQWGLDLSLTNRRGTLCICATMWETVLCSGVGCCLIMLGLS